MHVLWPAPPSPLPGPPNLLSPMSPDSLTTFTDWGQGQQMQHYWCFPPRYTCYLASQLMTGQPLKSMIHIWKVLSWSLCCHVDTSGEWTGLCCSWYKALKQKRLVSIVISPQLFRCSGLWPSLVLISFYLMAMLERPRHLRDGWQCQNGWIFGKIPNGLWPPPSLSENHITNHCKKHSLKPCIEGQNMQYKLDLKWPPPRPLLERFRKFVHFGTVTRLKGFFSFNTFDLSNRISSKGHNYLAAQFQASLRIVSMKKKKQCSRVQKRIRKKIIGLVDSYRI